MAKRNLTTVVGVFSDQENARRAVRALKDAGFTEEQIGIAAAQREQATTATGESEVSETYSGEGALSGAAAGAGIGALWGLGILAGALPAIGPAIAGGTLAVLLSSAAAGAAAAGLAGALIGMGISKEEAEFYENEWKAGRTIVTVNAGNRRNEAWSILSNHGAYDMTTHGTAAPGTTTGQSALRANEAEHHALDIPVPPATGVSGTAGRDVRHQR